MVYGNGKIAEGTLLLMSAGEYDQFYVAGAFRASTDLDLEDLDARFWAKAAREGGVTVPEVDGSFGEHPPYDHKTERAFVSWLVEEGLVELVPTLKVHATGIPSPHGHGDAELWFEVGTSAEVDEFRASSRKI